MHTWHLAWCCFCEASSALWEYRWTWSHWTVDHGSSHQETPTNDNYFPLFFKSHYHITFHSDSPFLPSSASARLSRVTTVLTELSKSRARTFSLIADPLDPLTNVLKGKKEHVFGEKVNVKVQTLTDLFCGGDGLTLQRSWEQAWEPPDQKAWEPPAPRPMQADVQPAFCKKIQVSQTVCVQLNTYLCEESCKVKSDHR